MTNNIIWALLVGALAAIVVLFSVNLGSKIENKNPLPKDDLSRQLKFDRANVRGIAVEKDGKIYTLNQAQQSKALGFLDRAQPIDKTINPEKNTSFGFSKLIIYRVNSSDLTLIPISVIRSNLVFDAPLLKLDSYFLDESGGELNTIIHDALKENGSTEDTKTEEPITE